MPLLGVEIPKVGLVMETARVVRWLKAVGDTVTSGEPLLEVETEKSVIEIPATVSGRLVQILLDVDQEAKVGDRIALVESDDAAPMHASVADPRTRGGKVAPLSSATPAPRGARIRSSPVARRLAAEQGVDLDRIPGSGPRGRVQLDDVKHALNTGAPVRNPSPQPSPRERGEGVLSPMRRAVARAMTLSNATVPQFMVGGSFDVSTLQELRAGFSTSEGTPSLSVNDFLLQAVARTLLEFAELNATFWGDPNSPDARIVPAQGAHIGLVVAMENGLLVPVFHNVERLSLAQLARHRAEVIKRTLQGHLKREELEGATFSISNLGARGPDWFTALINPPQSAILAVGRQRDCAVPRNGRVEVRPICELTLTVDHRVTDGRVASEFLARLVETLEGRDWRVE